MKTKILSLLVILAIAVVSCQKDEADKPVVLQDVSFGIEHVDPMGLKDGSFDILCPENLTPVKAKIVIAGITDPFYPLVFFLNERWYTQAIKLEPGTYTIEEFYLLDADDNILMATPAAGSVYAPYVDGKTVAMDILVEAFVKKEFKMWVLCYEPAKYDEFGFFWFRINRIVVRTFCFFGDICANGEPYLPADFANTAYADLPGGLLMDMPAIFEIRAFDGDGDPLPYSPFSNLGFENLPLCVQYPDNIDIAGETFTFELWILEADGTYTHYHTFTVTDDQIDITDVDEDDVIEFVVGNCNYSATDLQLSWIIIP
jgi:hypothetical protein